MTIPLESWYKVQAKINLEVSLMNLLLAAAFTLILDGQEYRLQTEDITYNPNELTLTVNTKDRFLECTFNVFFWDDFEADPQTEDEE